MPPQDLSSRLKSLSDSHRETVRLIQRLSNFFPSTASTKDNDIRLELGAEIHQSLKDQDEELELLRQGTEDLFSADTWNSTRRRDSETNKNRVGLVTQVDRLAEDLKLARNQFRKAQLQAKRNFEASKRKERELLFAGVQEWNESKGNIGRPRRKNQEKFSREELELNASNDVTAGLRRIHQQLSGELERSQFAQDTLNQSTAALATLNESYSTLSTLLSSSRALVSTLLHSQKSDTWYLQSTVYILGATIGWLVFRRWLYGPLWWFLYLPIKLVFSFISIIAQIALSATTGLLAGSKSRPGDPGQQIRESARASLNVKPSAVRGSAPRFSDGGRPMDAPGIRSGAGGKGAKDLPEWEQEKVKGGLVEEVGRMIEESQKPAENREEEREGAKVEDGGRQEETVLRPRLPDEKPNPKKKYGVPGDPEAHAHNDL